MVFQIRILWRRALFVAKTIYLVRMIVRAYTSAVQTTYDVTSYNGLTVSVAKPTITPTPISIAMCLALTTSKGLVACQTFRFVVSLILMGQVGQIECFASGLITRFKKHWHSDADGS